MPVPVDGKVARAIRTLFSPEQVAEVTGLLETDCGPDRIPGMSANTDAPCERVRLAALKCSGGSMDLLYEAIALAQTDYRDLLMAAGFGAPDAHLAWEPELSE